MPRISRPDLALALAGLLFAVIVHTWNGHLSDLPFGHHQTADDPSYLRPAENWLDNGTWKDNTDGVSAYIQRTPGMGIIHLPFYLLLGDRAYVGETVLFFLLHGLALYFLPGLFRRFTDQRKAAVLSSIYAFLPCFWGFLTYTITESVTPSLVILALASLLSQTRYSLVAAIFLLFCMWMIRPVLILLFPLFLVVIWQKRREYFQKKYWWNLATIGLLLALAGSWEVRKKSILGTEPWSLHPIYSTTNQTQFRPLHRAFSDLFRIWETKPERFHALMGAYWGWGKTSPTPQLVRDYCKTTRVPLSPEQLSNLLHTYWVASETAKAYPALHGKSIDRETEPEKQVRFNVVSLTDSLRQTNQLQYHLVTPVRSAADLLSKSQLNLELFQRHYRGSWWVEVMRYGCLLLILAAVAGTFLSLFSREKVLRWLAAGFILYLFYLCYVQRMNEDRYMIPALPLIFLTGGVWWTRFIRWIAQRSGIV